MQNCSFKFHISLIYHWALKGSIDYVQMKPMAKSGKANISPFYFLIERSGKKNKSFVANSFSFASEYDIRNVQQTRMDRNASELHQLWSISMM